MLDQKKLDSLLAGCRFWEKVQCFETVDSTNLIVKDWARQGAEEGRYAGAEEQTAGRGRRGRSWISPPGENLYFSILLRPQAEASHVAMITLLMAISVTQHFGAAAFAGSDFGKDAGEDQMAERRGNKRKENLRNFDGDVSVCSRQLFPCDRDGNQRQSEGISGRGKKDS